MTDLELTMRFDLRVPPFAKTDFATQHRACLDMAEWADRLGFDNVVLSEHHGDPAGYCSAPLAVAAAILGRTKRIGVRLGALLAPLHDPVRLAEQIATIDCLAPGRLSIIVGAGYRTVEFEMAGVLRASRGRLVEDCIALWRQAWTGQPFAWRGRTLQVTPPAATPGGPQLYAGGKSVPAARRAARLRYDFYPANTDPAVREAYLAECRAQGFDGRVMGADPSRPARPGFLMISRDPEATWREIGSAAQYDAFTYASWQDDAVRSTYFVGEAPDLEAVRASGQYVVLTPADCIALARNTGGVTLHPLMGGIAPDLAWESLRLFENEVLPHLRGSRRADSPDC